MWSILRVLPRYGLLPMKERAGVVPIDMRWKGLQIAYNGPFSDRISAATRQLAVNVNNHSAGGVCAFGV
jgi:hypothetical protein